MEKPPRPRPLRRDAAENAERVMAAAIRAGLNEGRSVSLAQIAADAGVGVGTLYRRYPNREALMEALAMRAYGLLIDIAERAQVLAPTGLGAIECFLVESFEHRDELVLPLHGAPVGADAESERLAARLSSAIDAMVERGHRDGTVRSDATAWTVVRFGAMLAQPMSTDQPSNESAAEQRRVFLRGIEGR